MKKNHPEIPAEAYDIPELREKVFRPRHQVIYKLPSFPVCMVIYFRNPHFMAERHRWWEGVDNILDQLLELREDMTNEIVERFKADIEKVVPRVTPQELERLKVVLNDLPLHL